MRTPAQIYDAYRNGDSLTGEELVVGIAFYGELADKAMKAGDTFRLMAVEARRVHIQLENFQTARQRKWKP